MSTAAGKRIYIEDLTAALASLTTTVNDNTADIGQIQGGGGVLCIAAKVRNDGSTAVSTATVTSIVFSDPADVEFDDYGYHSTATNPTRFTVPSGKGGIHRIQGDVPWAADSTGTFRALYIYLNGTTRIGALKLGPATSTMRMSVSCLVQLSAADYVELQVEHNATGTVAIDGTGDFAAHFSIERCGT